MFTSLAPGAIGVSVDGLEQGLTLAADHGFDGYHFSIADAAAVGAERVRQLCEHTGVRLAAFGFLWNFAATRSNWKKAWVPLMRRPRWLQASA
jgi:sugar phosphate isomerase/epimerase